jgi:hypothetical protein
MEAVDRSRPLNQKGKSIQRKAGHGGEAAFARVVAFVEEG